MQKVKNLLNPGGYKDDEVLYGSGESASSNQAGSSGANTKPVQVSPSHADALDHEGPGGRHQHRSPAVGTEPADTPASGTLPQHAAPHDTEHPARTSITAVAHSRGEKGPRKELDPDMASGHANPAVGQTVRSSGGNLEEDQRDRGTKAAIIGVAKGRGERGHQESLLPQRDVAGAGDGVLSAQQDPVAHLGGKQSMHKQDGGNPASHSPRGDVALTSASQGDVNSQRGDSAWREDSGNPSRLETTETSSLGTAGATGTSRIDNVANTGGVGLTATGAHRPQDHSHSGTVIHDSMFLNKIDPRVNNTVTGPVIGGTNMDTHEFDDKSGRHHGFSHTQGTTLSPTGSQLPTGHGSHRSELASDVHQRNSGDHPGRDLAPGVGAVGAGGLVEHELRDKDQRTGHSGSTLRSQYDQHTPRDVTGRQYPVNRDSGTVGPSRLADHELAHRDKPLGHTHGNVAGDTSYNAEHLDSAHKGYPGRAEMELENRDSRHTHLSSSTTDPVPKSTPNHSGDQRYGQGAVLGGVGVVDSAGFERQNHDYRPVFSKDEENVNKESVNEQRHQDKLLAQKAKEAEKAERKHEKQLDKDERHDEKSKSGGLLSFLKRDTRDKDDDTSAKNVHGHHEHHGQHENETAEAAAVSGAGRAAHEDDSHHRERNKLHKDPPPGYIPAGYAEAPKSE